jgi:probable phosphoglycerate mutase
MKNIFVIRHGQTEWNLARRMQGRLDSPLTHTGSEQAHGHGEVLKSLGRIDEMFVSPSGRTQETAYILNSYVRAPVTYQDALLERDLGTWSGLTVDELEDSFPNAWRARTEDPFNHRPPEGESLKDMGERCAAFLAELLESPALSSVLVTHQVMSRVILGRLLGLTPEETVLVIHPNEAFYQLQISDVVEVRHYISGAGPFDGLLHHSDDETISRRTRTEWDGLT